MSKNIKKETYLTFDEVGRAEKISVWNVYSESLPAFMVGSGFKTKKKAERFAKERIRNL